MRQRYPRHRWIIVNALAVAAVLAALWLGSDAWRWWIVGAVGAGYTALVAAGVCLPTLGMFVHWLHRGDRTAPRIALTFDDGPAPEATGRLLDLLAARQVRATFFCVGRQVERWPQVTQRIVADGHEIANHTYDHHWWLNLLPGTALRQQIERTQAVIEQVTGVIPRWFRPPMGLSNPHTGPAVRDAQLVAVGWDVRSLDRPRITRRTARRVLARLRPGSIVLLHDGGADPEALCDLVRTILDGAAERGLQPVCVGELADHINVPPPRGVGKRCGARTEGQPERPVTCPPQA